LSLHGHTHERAVMVMAMAMNDMGVSHQEITRVYRLMFEICVPISNRLLIELILAVAPVTLMLLLLLMLMLMLKKECH
jgi:hypothetical protein